MADAPGSLVNQNLVFAIVNFQAGSAASHHRPSWATGWCAVWSEASDQLPVAGSNAASTDVAMLSLSAWHNPELQKQLHLMFVGPLAELWQPWMAVFNLARPSSRLPTLCFAEH